jgi:class 3 adenylate cyclase/tetratricopeptide (TPR) repeat protein
MVGASPQVPAEPATERRLVSVLFCDLVGFTARSDRADPEDVRATLRPFHALARAEIERFGGTLDKFIGDAAMGVFGVPAAHEDDPERAVRAGLAIVDGAARLTEGRTGPLDVRVGIATGEAVVALAGGEQEGEAVAGDVVNTAARIQAAAPPGGVLVGEETHRATLDAVAYDAATAISAKGKAEPVAVWRAVAVRALPTISERSASAAFVGRDEELGLLREAFERAVSRPGIELVTLVAGPGVGKSRLVAEMRPHLDRAAGDRGLTWRRGRCLPYGEGITFWAFGEVVKESADILESDPPEERDRKLDEAVRRAVPAPDDAAWIRSRLAPLVGLEAGPPVERDESFAAWRGFLEALARPGPLVVVVEDLHWADPALAAFLDDLVESGSSAPILVLTTARPEVEDRHASLLRARPNASVLSLRPLSAEESSALVSELLADRDLAEETRRALSERSGGNPLFAQELVRSLLERGPASGADSAGASEEDLAFPTTIHGLIASRLDALPAERRHLLHDASVIGAVFWSGAVAFVGGSDEPVVLGHLDGLDRRELIRPIAVSSFQDQAEFAFWHGLIRDVAYEQIPRAARARRHRRAAEWLESIAGERPGDVAEILAHHATSALDLAMAAGEGDDIPALQRNAARYLHLAAMWTMTLDLSKAQAQLDRALDLIGPDDPLRPQILATRGEVAFHGGRLDEADADYALAVDGLRAQGAVREAGDAMTRRSVVLEYRGDKAKGHALLSEALALLSELPPGPEQARTLATSAGSLLIGGNYVEAVAEADRAIGVAEAVGERAAAARAHGFRGFARAILGDLDGFQEQRDALEALRSLGLGRATAIVYNNLGTCLTHSMGLQPALEVLREGQAFAERRGLREMVMALGSAILTPLVDTGDWDEALRLQVDVAEEARREGSRFDEIYSSTDRGLILAHRRTPDAPAFCEEVLEAARPLEDAPVLLRALVGAGLTRQVSGDAMGTAAAVREALEVTQGDAIPLRAEEMPTLVRLAVAVGDVDLAQALFEGTEGLGLERQRFSIEAARAELDEALGRTEEALHGFLTAAERWNRWGWALEEAHALHGAGRCLRRLGRQEEAGVRFEQAALIFGRLGVTPPTVA